MNEKKFTRSFTIQGYKFAVTVSIILHLLVVLLLINTTDKPIDNFTKTPKVQPIKSFIYYKPVEIKKEKIVAASVNNEIKKELEKTPPLKEELQSSIKEPEQTKILSKPKVKSEQPSTPLATATAKQLKNQQAKPVKNYTNSQRLSRLKDKIKQQIIKQEMYNYSKPNTGSIMHGTPTYVPHSVVEDTEKKKISSTASQVGNGFSITKNDDGVCTLTEDLSTIGLQGKTTSQFGCGLSKSEKAFNSHMKKVRKKLGK
jgi:hypothetical protein